MTTIRTWTIEQMVAERPCAEYTRERIEELWAGRSALTLHQMLSLPIPPKDRMWVVWRPRALPPSQLVMVLDRVVTRAVTTYARHCGIDAVETRATHGLTEDNRTLEAARAAAWAARAAAEAAEAEYEAQISDTLAVLNETLST